jgi:hypothetical protein
MTLIGLGTARVRGTLGTLGVARCSLRSGTRSNKRTLVRSRVSGDAQVLKGAVRRIQRQHRWRQLNPR